MLRLAGVTTLAYDDEDRLVSLAKPGSAATTYAYNGADARVAKAGAGGARTYRRDGVGVTAPVLSDGVSTMVPGVSERTGGASRFQHPDRLGTAARKTDASGATVATRAYDAFGVPTQNTDPASAQGYASAFGYQEDAESGLKLLGHRYYDPGAGRFLTRDPVGSGTNWYRYADNNPLKNVDPDGLPLVPITPANDAANGTDDYARVMTKSFRGGATVGSGATGGGLARRGAEGSDPKKGGGVKGEPETRPAIASWQGGFSSLGWEASVLGLNGVGAAGDL